MEEVTTDKAQLFIKILNKTEDSFPWKVETELQPSPVESVRLGLDNLTLIVYIMKFSGRVNTARPDLQSIKRIIRGGINKFR